MTIDAPTLLLAPNISAAWARLFHAVDHTPGKELISAVISFTGFSAAGPIEEGNVREVLNTCLAEDGKEEIETVANTIFPQALWEFSKGDRNRFYAMYIENMPDYVAMAPSKNQRGTYFGRLTAYDLNPRNGNRATHLSGTPSGTSNQIEFIIEHCKRGARRSYLQASIFDPLRDHTGSAQLGFPCLQHITFIPSFGDSTLAMNAFYATQQLYEKAYGNFLGLGRLGSFIASESGLTLCRVTCLVGVEKIDFRPSRVSARLLRDAVDAAIQSG